ncbi:hypothetical protein OG21DRAFT_1479923 [Imleria badia]|nr:hypothetical protein OG21DRAFT_1479923 [Imleria badia]
MALNTILPTRTDIKNYSRENDGDDIWQCRESTQALFYIIATESSIRRDSDTERKRSSTRSEVAAEAHRTPRHRATSFISTRSAQKRDHAAEKWFTDVRELDINNADQPDDPKLLPRKKRMGFEYPKQHEMRPRTDLNALFTPSSAPSATSLRLQTKRELAGDYTSYLPEVFADPNRLPVAYARLVLGRNKHVPLSAQTGALNIIEEAIRGKTTSRLLILACL